MCACDAGLHGWPQELLEVVVLDGLHLRILRLRCRVVRRSLYCARLEARCLAMPLRSLACGFFAYNIYLGVTFCAMLFVIRECFYGNVFCGDVVSSGTAPSQSSSGWVASQDFLSVRCPSQSLLCNKGFSCSCYCCFCEGCAACETAGFPRL